MRTRRSQFSSDPVSPEMGKHRSVLLHEAVEQLSLQRDDIVVDATLGGAGHSAQISKVLSSEGALIGFDLDEAAIERARVALDGSSAKVTLINANFRHIKRELQDRGITRITKVLFDLGWSAYQLDAGRGFSFLKDEPLAMTYSAQNATLTAATIVNTWEEASIADVLWGWGEERYARRIAKAIVDARIHGPITSSKTLADIISAAVPGSYRHGKIHPATRSFQALRIAVNDELGALEEGLRGALELLEPGGRIAVITFHSIEDRIVKRMFAGFEESGQATRITKKPLTANEQELLQNPRARSAKLRVVQKLA